MLNPKPLAKTLLFSSVLLLPSPGEAQEKTQYYTYTHADTFEIDWVAFYDTLDDWTAKTRKKLPHTLDLAFGEHEKQKLDLYFPEEKPTKAPVFLFIHGGGFREGDRSHYGYVAGPFAKRGFITAVTSYRLTPQGFYYPSQPEDIRSALSWLYRNIANYGGDPDHIYVGGHSAGGILAAEVCVRGGWLKEKRLPADLIKGCAPISTSIVVGDPEAALGGGVYAIRKAEGNAYVADPALRQKADPLQNIDTAPPVVFFSAGTGEAILHDSPRLFVKRLKAMGSRAEFLVLEDHDHADTALVLGDEESILFLEIMKMFGRD